MVYYQTSAFKCANVLYKVVAILILSFFLPRANKTRTTPHPIITGCQQNDDGRECQRQWAAPSRSKNVQHVRT
jgi:hypothetical protein